MFYSERIHETSLFLVVFSAQFEFCYMQEEEQLRNSVMLDSLFVNRAHDLASQILLYYHVCSQSRQHERCVWPIDSNARLVNMLMVFFMNSW